MRLSDLLDRIAPAYHRDFIRFIESGEADADFLARLDEDPALQGAVEDAFNAQAATLQGLARAFDERMPAPDSASVAETVAGHLAAALTEASELPDQQQDEVVGRTMQAFNDRQRSRQVKPVLDKMESALVLV